MTVLDNGIRYKGGVADIIGPLDRSDNNFWLVFVYGYSYYILVDLILLSILYGTIVDAVAEMREKQKDLEEDVQNKCFVCGLSRSNLDRNGEGWYQHIYRNHNIFTYLYFLIFIDKKVIGDCSSVEKYVKELSKAGDISFFPQGRSIGIEKNEDRGNQK